MVMRLMPTVLGAALLVTAACGVKAGGLPEIEVDRTACSHCGMLISEPLYAAAYQAPGAAARVFDDIGCLRDAARAAPIRTARAGLMTHPPLSAGRTSSG